MRVSLNGYTHNSFEFFKNSKSVKGYRARKKEEQKQL